MGFLGPLLSGIGSIFGQSSANKHAAQQLKFQQDFAQQGIRWKVNDAIKAGIHPLVGLGAQTHSYSPVSLDTSGYRSAGQDLGRAVQAVTTTEAKNNDFSQAAQALSLDRMKLENETIRNNLVASQIRVQNQAGNPPHVSGLPGSYDRGQEKSGTTELGPINIDQNPNWSDAQKIQQRYGEPAEYPYFPAVTGADLWWKLQNLAEELAGQSGNRDRRRPRNHTGSGHGW